MFRRITALVCALALAGALSWTAQAAPVTGSFGLDLVFFPAEIRDCDPGPAFRPCKVDYVAVKFEADLVLSMSISGLDLTSTTLFTFHGVEVQLFSAKATVGAMTFTTVLAFAPNILEFEDARSSAASRGWCLSDTAPGPLPAAASCANGFNARPYPGGPRFFDIFLSDPVVQNIYLGLWTDGLIPGGFPVSQLTPALTFRKKIAEVTLSIAGLTLGLRALFGNFGTSSAPDFRAGLVLILSGQTVSGITVRSETWVGARQGFECFGECKPASRLGFIISTFAPVPSLGGVVGPSIPFEPQEEKLFITGLTLAGIRNDIAMEFVLAGAGASSLQPTNMSITSTWRITPLRLTITNIARFGAGLTLVRDIMLFGINIGEVGTTVQLDFRPNLFGAWETYFTALIMEFDPPGGKATIVALSCDFDTVCLAAPGFYPFLEVDYDIAFEVGDLSVEIVAVMVGSLLKDLAEVDIYASWSLGGAVSIDSVTILTPDALFAQKFGVTVKF
jgi:hypothetical protein